MTPEDLTAAQKILGTIISYARQPSTYRGLIAIAGAIGWHSIEPSTYNAILAGMVLLYGLINFFRNEHKIKITPELIEQSGEAMLRAYFRAKRRSADGSNTNSKRGARLPRPEEHLDHQ